MRVTWMFLWMIMFIWFTAKRCGDVFFDILIPSKGGSALAIFNTFRNFNKSLNKRRMSLAAQTVTTEWTAEKWLEKRVQGKQMPKHKLDNGTNSVGRRSLSKQQKQFEQQRQQRQRQHRLKNDLKFNLRISQELGFIQSVCTVRNIPNRIGNFKNWPSYSSRFLEYAKCGHFTMLFCDLL